jgi:hypothetical protein
MIDDVLFRAYAAAVYGGACQLDAIHLMSIATMLLAGLGFGFTMGYFWRR